VRLLGRQLNDLLEAQGDGRPMDEEGIYIMKYGGKIVPLEEFLKELEESSDLSS